jgi:polysaccharide export outer membrane protein
MKNYITFLLCFVCFSLLSCASTQTKGGAVNSEVYVSNSGDEDFSIQNQVMDGISAVQNSRNYVLQPGDLVEIKVFMESSMDRILRISSDGVITFPLVGNIKIGGYTIAEAEIRLIDKLNYYIKNPQVSMLIREYSKQMVYVLGQVHRPSGISIPPEKDITVLEAIISVGGFTAIANTSKVKILRLEDGKQKSIYVDVGAITKQGKKSLDVKLLPGDVVFVPESIF